MGERGIIRISEVTGRQLGELKVYTMKKYILFFLLIFSVLNAETGNIEIADFKSEGILAVVDYGHQVQYNKNCPVFAFDGDISTCLASGSYDASFKFTMKFNKSITVDEIRIINGYGRNARQRYMYTAPSVLSFYIDNEKGECVCWEELELKYSAEIQSIPLKKEYTGNSMLFSSNGVSYRGNRFFLSCITEIEFYYKGKKIFLNNAAVMAKTCLEEDDN